LIVKEREVPMKIQQYEALLRRLLKRHELIPEIEAELKKRYKGYKGELSVDYYTDLLTIEKKEIRVFQNLRLPYGPHFFQIDTLLIFPQFVLILEVKNISGTLIFDPDREQMVRVYNEKEEGFQCPIAQVKRHRIQLMQWMKSRKFPSIPIEYLVVVSNPATILKFANGNNRADIKKVIHGHSLVNKVYELSKMIKTQKFDDKQLKRVSRGLLKDHRPSPPENLMKLFNFSIENIATGVLCPSCEKSPMVRTHGSWFCSTCREWKHDAHNNALSDYFLLLNDSITTRQFCHFAHISSNKTGYRLLQTSNLSFSGTGRARKYFLPSS
jgi:Nuclease-related domain